MALEVESRGPFAKDEIPEDIVMVFLRPQAKGGGPVNLTGYDAEIDIVKPDNTLVTRSANIPNPEDGEVRYTWESDDFDQPGEIKVQFWVFSGSPEATRLASKVVQLNVFDAPRHTADV